MSTSELLLFVITMIIVLQHKVIFRSFKNECIFALLLSLSGNGKWATIFIVSVIANNIASILKIYYDYKSKEQPETQLNKEEQNE